VRRPCAHVLGACWHGALDNGLDGGSTAGIAGRQSLEGHPHAGAATYNLSLHPLADLRNLFYLDVVLWSLPRDARADTGHVVTMFIVGVQLSVFSNWRFAGVVFMLVWLWPSPGPRGLHDALDLGGGRGWRVL